MNNVDKNCNSSRKSETIMGDEGDGNINNGHELDVEEHKRFEEHLGTELSRAGCGVNTQKFVEPAMSNKSPSKNVPSLSLLGQSDEDLSTPLSPLNLRNRQLNSSPNRVPLQPQSVQPQLNNQVQISMSQPHTQSESLTSDDPLSLTSLLKTEEDFHEMEQNGATKKLLKFYKGQNELIKALTAPISALHNDVIMREKNLLRIAIYGSICANIVLFGLQLAAAVLSGSLSLFATTADAFMDLLSNAILLVTNYLAGKNEIYRYPAGKGRFETAGIIVFASLMATLSIQLIIKAGESLVGTPESPSLGIISICFVGVAITTKLCLYLYCRLLTDQPAAQVLAQDQRNDIFINGFGLALGILGDKVSPYIDPIGAIVVALIILRSWSYTILEQCQLIVGKSADPTFLKKVIYIAMTHDERILQVDTCRVYHAGSKVIAEVDIVLPPETSLQVSHDVGETLQVKLESLPNVDRAFVHCDYETTHAPEHQKWV